MMGELPWYVKYGRDERPELEFCDGQVIAHQSRNSVTHYVPTDERQAAAQALAGDGYRVVPADVPHGCSFGPDGNEACGVCGAHLPEWERELLAQQDRPEPVDPATVRVGDHVIVEDNGGDWHIRGDVDRTDPRSAYPFRVFTPHMHAGGIWPRLEQATVRVLRSAEPEPDPEQVQALEQILGEIQRMDLQPTTDAVPRELVRRKSDVAKALGLSDGGPHGE